MTYFINFFSMSVNDEKRRRGRESDGPIDEDNLDYIDPGTKWLEFWKASESCKTIVSTILAALPVRRVDNYYPGEVSNDSDKDIAA